MPMTVRDPRVANTPIVRDATALSVDVELAVSALADVVTPMPADGASCARSIVGPPPAQRWDDVLLEHWRGDRAGDLSYGMQISDGDRWRPRDDHPGESCQVELDDLIAGPTELGNKAGYPTYADMQERLAQRLAALLE